VARRVKKLTDVWVKLLGPSCSKRQLAACRSASAAPIRSVSTTRNQPLQENPMPRFPKAALARLAAAASVAALLAACQTGPQPVTVSDVVEATAVVEKIDVANRRALLRTPDGRVVGVRAGPEAVNFGKVKVGDTVRVRFTEAVAAEVVKPGTPLGTSTTVGGAPAAAGMPGGSQSVSVRTVVRVAAVDTVNNTVDVTDPQGAPGVQRIRVKDTKAREFIRGLKPGDEVQLTITEAIALSVEPAAR